MNARNARLYVAAAAVLAGLALGCAFQKAPTSDEAWFFNPVYGDVPLEN